MLAKVQAFRDAVTGDRGSSASSLSAVLKAQGIGGFNDQRVYAARRDVIGDLEANVHANMQRLSEYTDMLCQNNPGSVAIVTDEEDNTFYCLTVALAQVATVFNAAACRFVAMDAAHCKHSAFLGWKIILLEAIFAEKVVPVAFVFGRSETKDLYKRLLTAATNAGLEIEPSATNPIPCVIVSDRHKSIAPAIKSVVPRAHPMGCAHHLGKNVYAQADVPYKFLGGRSPSSFQWLYDIINAANQAELYDAWKVLEAKNNPAYKYLIDQDIYEHYTTLAVRCAGARSYGRTTSQAVETENSRQRKNRWLDPLELMDGILVTTNSALLGIANDVKKLNMEGKKLLPSIRAKYEEEVARANSMEVILQPHFTALVQNRSSSSQHRYKVSFIDNSCSCLRWWIQGYPCCHAIAGAKSMKLPRFMDGDEWYTTNHFDRAFLVVKILMPLMTMPTIAIPDATQLIPVDSEGEVKLPVAEKKKGRRKDARIPSAGERHM